MGLKCPTADLMTVTDDMPIYFGISSVIILYLCIMSEAVSLSLFPESFPSEEGRRRSVPKIRLSVGGAPASRRERIDCRNRVMTARYYYWTELKRRRFDDTIRILSDQEFFVEDRTITNALMEHDGFFRTLASGHADNKSLKEMFPGWDWSI